MCAMCMVIPHGPVLLLGEAGLRDFVNSCWEPGSPSPASLLRWHRMVLALGQPAALQMSLCLLFFTQWHSFSSVLLWDNLTYCQGVHILGTKSEREIDVKAFLLPGGTSYV